ncbi:hypothetical protein [Shewanella waksmanii]|uniref:hypothetical protein n=1 Tax=Shewanella waksmanii TaxID=213783 RepID=UPI00048BE736|nr:hypothetical protein [Shewanella waksmanii]
MDNFVSTPKQSHRFQANIERRNKSHAGGWGRDLLEADTLFALVKSMCQSKTLTMMVLFGLCFFGGFFLLLKYMAG